MTPPQRIQRFTIETPEGVSFALDLAGPVSRLLAWVVDLLCKLLLIIAANLVVGLLGLLSNDLAMSIMTILAFVIVQGYQISLEYLWRGQTIGKRLLKLRVMDEQGMQLRFAQVALRNLLRVADQLPLLYLVGGMAMTLNVRAQRLGDFAANTIVVRARESIPYVPSGADQAKYNSFRQYPHLEARLRQRVPAEAAALAVQALNRRETLASEHRLALMQEFAQYFRNLVRFPSEVAVGIADEQYVRNVVDSVLRTRHADKSGRGA
jgi:uncharacterized RDD family membrane protein YckC